MDFGPTGREHGSRGVVLAGGVSKHQWEGGYLREKAASNWPLRVETLDVSRL